MFESRTPAGVAWSYDMEGHAQQCVQRCCELESLKSLLGWSPFQEREELESVGELAKVCSQIALKCLYFARIGRPDVLWSANKLARSVTKLTHWESGRHSTWCDLVSKNPHSATASQNCGTSGPKSLENLEDPVVPLERNLCGHPLAWLVRERQFEEVLLELGWKRRYRIGNVYLFTEYDDYFCQCMWITSKRLEESRIWVPCGKKLTKLVDLGEPTILFLDHVYLGCTQLECKSNENITEEYRKMFGSRMNLHRSNWKVTWVGKCHAKTVAWSYDMEGGAKKCGERIVNWANKTRLSNCTRSRLHGWTTETSKMEELETVGESKVSSQSDLKCLYSVRKILWSLLNDISMFTHWQASCGRDKSKKFFLGQGWDKGTEFGMSTGCCSELDIFVPN